MPFGKISSGTMKLCITCSGVEVMPNDFNLPFQTPIFCDRTMHPIPGN